jgi:serine/threonine protein phosphatase PrpC
LLTLNLFGAILVRKFFNRIFYNQNEGRIKVEDKTLPMERNHKSEVLKSSSSTKYQIASCQSPGKERFHNEDTLFTSSSELCGVDAPVYFGLFLVADGMGGHQSGEVASKLAAKAVSRELMDRLFIPILYEKQTPTDAEMIEWMKSAVDQAQTLIHHQVPGGGTTLTLSIVIGDQIYSAHVGDSRLYLVGKDGQLNLKTKDHSLVKRLIDLGEITAQEASIHPQRNILFRALGQVDPLEPDLDQFSLEVGERLMICSDGLWGVLDKTHMENILKVAKPLDKITCELVNAANAAGGPDNISVVLVERLS